MHQLKQQANTREILINRSRGLRFDHHDQRTIMGAVNMPTETMIEDDEVDCETAGWMF